MMKHKMTDSLRILRDVVHQANIETRRLRRAKFEFGLFSLLVVLLLTIDYTMARVMFTYLDPTLGDVSLGPEILALCVPTAVVAVHLLIAEEQGYALDYRLRRLAGVGVILFLFGLASMVSLVYFDASDGVGAPVKPTAIDGTIGDKAIGLGGSLDGGLESSWIFSAFRAVFTTLSPILFFAGMTLILFVTVYASHRLLLKIEERYEFFSNTTKRSHELKQLFSEVEACMLDIKKSTAQRDMRKKKLPGDPEQKFAQIASAAIHASLHHMKKSLRSLDESDEVMAAMFTRKAHIPPHIKSRKDGQHVIADIRYKTTPYAILRDLDGFPPKEEV